MDAAAKLKALDKFSGRELAKALMRDKSGETVWSKGFWGMNSVAKTVDGLHLVKAQFKELMASTERLRKGGEDPQLATGDVRRILLGENSLSSIVEAKARGFKPGDVNPVADESNIVESKTLGSGAAGTNYLLTTKSGDKLVFKPELDSRIGLDDLMLGEGGAYLDSQKTANLNLATQDGAIRGASEGRLPEDPRQGLEGGIRPVPEERPRHRARRRLRHHDHRPHEGEVA